MLLGLPSHGFFTDNSREFFNVKLDKLTSKLGLTVKFGPPYSPCNNGLNERNHALADLTIKKLMEERKTTLSDSLVKAAAWTHNTSINKIDYSPLQLVTGKSVTLPGLTTGNVSTESMTDCEAVQRTMENLNRTVSQFREADMKRKLKEYQGIQTQAYNILETILKEIEFGTNL